MRSTPQPAPVTGLAGGGTDTSGPGWLCKYISTGTWDLYFPGAKRAVVMAIQQNAVGPMQAIASNGVLLPVRIAAYNVAPANVNALWYFQAQVWY